MNRFIIFLCLCLGNYSFANANTLCQPPQGKIASPTSQLDNEDLVKAQNGDVLSQITLAENCYKNEIPNYESALHWLKLASESGHPLAINTLGTFYQFGRGVEKNFEEAAKLYERAALTGLPVAQYNLGWIYYYGSGGIGIDIPKAFLWFSLGAWGGEPRAQAYLASLYRNGRANVPKNLKLAYVWATISVNTSQDKTLVEQTTALRKKLEKMMSETEIIDAKNAVSETQELMKGIALLRLPEAARTEM